MTKPDLANTPDTDGPPDSWSLPDHVCDAACEEYLERAWKVFVAQVEPGDFDVAKTTTIWLKD